MTLRFIGAALLIFAAVSLPAVAKTTRHPVSTPIAIAVSINGAPLNVEPPPRFVGGRLLVPVRRILDALGLPFDRRGKTITTQAGDRTITLTADSELRGVLYAPLRFFSAGLGASAEYDSRSKTVEIISSLLGHSSVVSVAGGGREYMGVVQAVDNDSRPPAITVTSGASVKTLRISPGAHVLVNDAAANTTVPGSLESVHVGDYAKISVRKDGSVDRVIDSFASSHGRIAAINGNTILLNDGQVIVPTGVTALSLNGEGARTTDLQVGDAVDVRYNLETSEIREIIASRKAPTGMVAAGSVEIESIEPSLSRPLRQGDSFSITMHATPGGQARFDVGAYFTGLAMTESSPGVYTGRYTIPRGANFASAPIFGHLNVHGTEAPRAQSLNEISASSLPPGVNDIAPEQGQTVNNPQPSIYATFTAGAVPVSPSSVVLIVNGHDVTASTTRTARFVEYHPLSAYGDGPVRVTVRVGDQAGNATSKSWTFTIRTH
ncbi:MAG: copper amine oxidase N-terminal domain-containing protein [Candidatus Eremiobacteraeota bacterium]|nr:copper amine oxidase N-terminal domain-containing protein [Candidatus Eremiobacteraeota bacterium]